jgi:hypothetical protein
MVFPIVSPSAPKVAAAIARRRGLHVVVSVPWSSRFLRCVSKVVGNDHAKRGGVLSSAVEIKGR